VGRIAGARTEDTRQRLLEAAAEEFDRRGFEGARVADIAERAGLSNGALYGHFRSKSDLLAAALSDRGARQLDILFLHADGRTIADLLAGIGRTLDRLPEEASGLIVEALVAARRDAAVADVTGRHLTEVEDRVAGLVRSGQADGVVDRELDAGALAHFCVMAVLGAMLLQPVSRPQPGWADLIGRFASAVSTSR
jgi:AcrR family transcriptional regulator